MSFDVRMAVYMVAVLRHRQAPSAAGGLRARHSGRSGAAVCWQWDHGTQGPAFPGTGTVGLRRPYYSPGSPRCDGSSCFSSAGASFVLGRVGSRGGPGSIAQQGASGPVSYTHLRAHETVLDIVCRLL